MKPSTQEWLSRAKDDLDVAEKIQDCPHLTNMVAFHAQQVIEKSFKAELEETNQDIPKLHNLVRLHYLVKDTLGLEIDDLRLKEISDVYTDTRYPREIGLLPDVKPAIEDAARFFQFAQQIYQHILKRFSETDIAAHEEHASKLSDDSKSAQTDDNEKLEKLA